MRMTWGCQDSVRELCEVCPNAHWCVRCPEWRGTSSVIWWLNLPHFFFSNQIRIVIIKQEAQRIRDLLGAQWVAQLLSVGKYSPRVWRHEDQTYSPPCTQLLQAWYDRRQLVISQIPEPTKKLKLTHILTSGLLNCNFLRLFFKYDRQNGVHGD